MAADDLLDAEPGPLVPNITSSEFSIDVSARYLIRQACVEAGYVRPDDERVDQILFLTDARLAEAVNAAHDWRARRDRPHATDTQELPVIPVPRPAAERIRWDAVTAPGTGRRRVRRVGRTGRAARGSSRDVLELLVGTALGAGAAYVLVMVCAELVRLAVRA